MIELERVRVEYPDATPLDGVSMVIEPGTTAVMGPSGSGKSTLLRLIAGLQPPTTGAVRIEGEPVNVATWRTAGDSRVSLIHQDYRLVPFLTVRENLLLAAELRGAATDGADVEDALARVGLDPAMADRLPATMSGGEQQRVAIARTLIAGASVVLADEPTGALDVENTRRVVEILVGLGRTDGLTIVVATHDPEVAAILDRRMVLSGGELAAA